MPYKLYIPYPTSRQQTLDIKEFFNGINLNPNVDAYLNLEAAFAQPANSYLEVIVPDRSSIEFTNDQKVRITNTQGLQISNIIFPNSRFGIDAGQQFLDSIAKNINNPMFAPHQFVNNPDVNAIGAVCLLDPIENLSRQLTQYICEEISDNRNWHEPSANLINSFNSYAQALGLSAEIQEQIQRNAVAKARNLSADLGEQRILSEPAKAKTIHKVIFVKRSELEKVTDIEQYVFLKQKDNHKHNRSFDNLDDAENYALSKTNLEIHSAQLSMPQRIHEKPIMPKTDEVAIILDMEISTHHLYANRPGLDHASRPYLQWHPSREPVIKKENISKIAIVDKGRYLPDMVRGKFNLKDEQQDLYERNATSFRSAYPATNREMTMITPQQGQYSFTYPLNEKCAMSMTPKLTLQEVLRVEKKNKSEATTSSFIDSLFSRAAPTILNQLKSEPDARKRLGLAQQFIRENPNHKLSALLATECSYLNASNNASVIMYISKNNELAIKFKDLESTTSFLGKLFALNRNLENIIRRYTDNPTTIYVSSQIRADNGIDVLFPDAKTKQDFMSALGLNGYSLLETNEQTLSIRELNAYGRTGNLALDTPPLLTPTQTLGKTLT